MKAWTEGTAAVLQYPLFNALHGDNKAMQRIALLCNPIFANDLEL